MEAIILAQLIFLHESHYTAHRINSFLFNRCQIQPENSYFHFFICTCSLHTINVIQTVKKGYSILNTSLLSGFGLNGSFCCFTFHIFYDLVSYNIELVTSDNSTSCYSTPLSYNFYRDQIVFYMLFW
jgi:hypothetical protein